MVPFRFQYILNPDDKLVQWFVNGVGSTPVLNVKRTVWNVVRFALLLKWGILLRPIRFIQAWRMYK